MIPTLKSFSQKKMVRQFVLIALLMSFILKKEKENEKEQQVSPASVLN